MIQSADCSQPYSTKWKSTLGLCSVLNVLSPSLMPMMRVMYVLSFLTPSSFYRAETTHSTTNWYTALSPLASLALSACWTPSTPPLLLPGTHRPQFQLQTMPSQPMLHVLPNRLSIRSWRVTIAMLFRQSIVVSSARWYSRMPWTSEL